MKHNGISQRANRPIIASINADDSTADVVLGDISPRLTRYLKMLDAKKAYRDRNAHGSYAPPDDDTLIVGSAIKR